MASAEGKEQSAEGQVQERGQDGHLLYYIACCTLHHTIHAHCSLEPCRPPKATAQGRRGSMQCTPHKYPKRYIPAHAVPCSGTHLEVLLSYWRRLPCQLLKLLPRAQQEPLTRQLLACTQQQ